MVMNCPYGAIEVRRDDHVVVSTVRNEILRLPYWLDYYRSLGFDRFFMVDNGSTDGTYELLLAQDDVTLFWTDESYAGGSCGVDWMNEIMDGYCRGHWVLMVDADELLVWPGCERETIQGLTAWFEGGGHAEALFVLMLDMYSDRPFGQVGYVVGMPFEDACPFFDHAPYQLQETERFPHRLAYGGARTRTFDALNAKRVVASKVPLLHWREGLAFSSGAHTLTGRAALAPMRGALLHFKLFDDIVEKCRVEAERREHSEGGREYVALGRVLHEAPGGFYDPGCSTRYEGPAQLVSLGLMDGHDPFGGLTMMEGPAG
jgi:hypothetical protein